MRRTVALGVALGLALGLAGRPDRAAAADAGLASGPGATISIDPVAPAAPTVRAVLSAREVNLGEVFFLLIDVDHQPGVEVSLPTALPLGLDLEETGRTDQLAKNPSGGLTRRFEVALMAFALGEVEVPRIAVTWVALGKVHDVVSDPLAIVVHGVVADAKATLKGIAPPVQVLRRDLTPIWIGGGALAVVLGGLATWWLIRRGRKRSRSAELGSTGAPSRPPHDEALARLAEVEASGALDADDRKPVYLALSEIIRAYAGRRYGFGALDLTTAEIRVRLAALPDHGGALARICDWLERGDLVKYARSDASEDEARQALYEARIFVERTREDAAADDDASDDSRTAGAEA